MTDTIVTTIETLPVFPCEMCGRAMVNRFRTTGPDDLGNDVGIGWWECLDHPREPEAIE